MKNDFSLLYPDFPFPLPLFLDGATGTELIKAGMPSGVCPELWILDHPEVLTDLQRRYLAAGSHAVLSPTFGANRTVLSRYGAENRVGELNEALVSLSKNAAMGKNALVAGDISPTGRYLAPVGDADFEELVTIYREQAEALSPHVDFFFIETNMDLAAVRAAVLGVKEASSKPIFVTMTVTESGRTLSGDTAEACLLTLSELSIHAFGLNCSCGPREMLTHLRPLLPLSLALGIPLIAKPNGGTGDAHLGKEEFAALVREMAECGIAVLGGCCGTDPSYIEALTKNADFHPTALPPKAKDTEHLACNNKTVVTVPKEGLPAPLLPTEDILDDADEMAEEHGFLYLTLPDKEAADDVLEVAPFLAAPVALCGEEDAIAYFRRHYCGKAPII